MANDGEPQQQVDASIPLAIPFPPGPTQPQQCAEPPATAVSSNDVVVLQAGSPVLQGQQAPFLVQPPFTAATQPPWGTPVFYQLHPVHGVGQLGGVPGWGCLVSPSTVFYGGPFPAAPMMGGGGQPPIMIPVAFPQTAPQPTTTETAHHHAPAPHTQPYSATASVANPLHNIKRLPMVLYMDFDAETLSDYQCLLRQQIEVFEAGPDDVNASAQGRNNPILLGQVGIRCRHCAAYKVKGRGSVYYSRTIDGCYQIAQNMSKLHFCQTCKMIPNDIQSLLSKLQKNNRRAAGGKEYWAEGLRVLGVYEDGNVMRFRYSTLTNNMQGASQAGAPPGDTTTVTTMNEPQETTT